MTEKPYYYDRALDKIKNRETGDDYWFLCDIADLLNKQDKIIKDKEKLIKAKNQQLEDVKQILKSEMKYACKQKQEYINDPYVYNTYSVIEHGLIKTLEELGWD